MDVESIIRKNKQKRKNYLIEDNTKEKGELSPKLKYVKGLISRILFTIIFVLGSIIYTNLNSKNLEQYQKYVFETSLSFTKINNIYQKLFGKVDIISNKEPQDTPVFFNSINYHNIEPFKNGAKLSVNLNQVINVITSGIVVFIGEKDDLGNTVIIQGNDGVDIWYSNITDSNIKVYDYVEAGTILGTTNSDFIYLTLNKDGKYISYEEYEQLT